MASRRPPSSPNETKVRRPAANPPAEDLPSRTHTARKQGYETGKEYKLPNDSDANTDEIEGESLTEDGRDIYGENDPLPEDLEPDGVQDLPDDSPDATRAGPPRKLIIVAGPDKGTVKRFTSVRMVIGRTPGCTVKLSDNSVSRRHLELVQGASGVLLRDLGSGNGTTVNNEKVTERLLKHEDLIEIGATRLRFVDEVEAVRLAREEAERREEEARRKKDEEDKKKADAEAAAKAAAEAAQAALEAAPAQPEVKPSARSAGDDDENSVVAKVTGAFKGLDLKQKVVVSIAGLAVLLVTFVVLPILFHTSEPVKEIDPREEAANKKMDLARIALADERCEDAMALMDSAEKLHPGIDSDGFFQRAKDCVAAQKGLASAKKLIEEARYDDARAELAKVPESSVKFNEDKKQVEQELQDKQVGSLQKAADDAIGALDIASAKQIVAQLPGDLQKAYIPKLAKALKEEQRQRHAQEVSSVKEKETREREEVEARKQAIDAQFRAVERKFQSGEFDRAALECDRVLDTTSDPDVRTRGTALKRLIPQFARLFEDGESKHRIGALESSVRPLKKARELYLEINFPGALGVKLDDHLSESLDAAGKGALLRGDLSTAEGLFRDALKLNPNDEAATGGLQRLTAKADDLYAEAYLERDRDPKAAIERCRLVLEIAPKSSEAYNKAKEMLLQLQPH